MNRLREAIGNYFQSPMGKMNFAQYFAYVNTAGKITARSLMDTQAVIMTYIEDQERVNEETQTSFKQIEDILIKLVDGEKKEEVSSNTLDTEEFIPMDHITTPEKKIVCPECGKLFQKEFGLRGHLRSHKPKVK